ncbi:hypothetical protein IV454_06265 [Massilia antarctica]|uniref:Uncharacterized protein n=1 Tax=Massilia antarctica TaxID=2765360 RepID=A0AA48WGF2_9BURK|nr:hypothetical protein [Massilia antarctica]QPI51134.1 hypothetical protein IV454_06265 [Massilia antarctica]
MWSPRSQDSSAEAGKAEKRSSPGGFGSFGGAPAQQDSGSQAGLQKPGSVLSQRLTKGSAEANALRTLEARRAAEQAANAPREIKPVPSGGQYGSGNAGQYGNNSGGQYSGNGNGQYNGNGMPAPIIVPQNNNGMGSAILGFLLGRSMSNSHAHSGYPGNTNNSGMVGTNPGSGTTGTGPVAGAEVPPERSFGKSLLRTFVWLVILSVLAWGAYLGWKFLRRGKAPSTANYTFDRN